MRVLWAIAAAAIPKVAAAPGLSDRQSGTTITIDVSKKYQTMDGFGFSEAFQRANTIVKLPEKQQKELLETLFDATSGAGMTILRIGIGSSPDSSSDHMNTIEPKSPGSPSASPNYVWDGKDSGQLFVAQQAYARGVRTFYADAWSAPGFMKTTGNENNGGTLCGVSGAKCSSGDWRQAYADYLVQYVKYYKEAGIDITYLGFLNEPEYSPSYAGMLSSGTQAADFIKILAPTIQAANLSTGIACCDSEGWSNQGTMTSQIKAAGAESLLSIITSHSYTSSPGSPINTSKKVWQTENADLQGAWQSAWYSSGGAGEGMHWASLIHTAVVNANCSAYLYWVGVQGGSTNSKLVRVDGSTYTISKRLWAFSQWARGARPGSVRVGVSGGGSGLQASAYLREDGSLAVLIINTGSPAASVTVNTSGGFIASTAKAWITDNTHDYSDSNVTISSGGVVSGSVPGRSMVTFVMEKQ